MIFAAAVSPDGTKALAGVLDGDAGRPDFTGATWDAFARQVRDAQSAKVVAAELGPSVNAVSVAKGRVLRRRREEPAGAVG